MTLNGLMTVTLRYFTEFGKRAFQHNRRVDLWRTLCTSLLYFVVRVRCRRKESSRSLFHLLMSFLLVLKLPPTAKTSAPIFTTNTSNDVVSRKDVPFGGPENKMLHFTFRSIFPQNAKFSPIFDGT